VALYLIHRPATPAGEALRNPHGAHSALVDAANPAAAITAANALVRGANGPFDGFTATEVAATAGGSHVDTYFDGDAVNLRGITRGGNAA